MENNWELTKKYLKEHGEKCSNLFVMIDTMIVPNLNAQCETQKTTETEDETI